MRGCSTRHRVFVGVTGVAIFGVSGILGPSTAFAAPSVTAPWSGTVPGAVCGSPRPIVLRHGESRVPTTRWPKGELRGGGGKVEVVGYGPVAHGNLANGLPVEVVNVSCTNGSGTADGELSDSLVVLNVSSRPPAVVGVLSPGVAANQQLLPAGFADGVAGEINIQPGRFAAQEVFYG